MIFSFKNQFKSYIIGVIQPQQAQIYTNICNKSCGLEDIGIESLWNNIEFRFHNLLSSKL
jgi:hypothetical protein